jgi:hypothetical protein
MITLIDAFSLGFLIGGTIVAFLWVFDLKHIINKNRHNYLEALMEWEQARLKKSNGESGSAFDADADRVEGT